MLLSLNPGREDTGLVLGPLVANTDLPLKWIHGQGVGSDNDHPPGKITTAGTRAGPRIIVHCLQLGKHTVLGTFIVINRHRASYAITKGCYARVVKSGLFVRRKRHVYAAVEMFIWTLGAGINIKLKDIGGQP